MPTMRHGAEEPLLPHLVGPVLDVGVPECRALAVTAVSGSGTVDGSSRPLGNATDHHLLVALRNWADVVLVGGRTAVAENYFGVRTDDTVASRRRAGGQSPVAPVAVVTRTLDLDPPVSCSGTRSLLRCCWSPTPLSPTRHWPSVARNSRRRVRS